MVTAGHPFHVEGQGWTPAEKLVPGNKISDYDSGTPVTVVASEEGPAKIEVFNLQVANYHSYYVGRLESWTHNYVIVDKKGIIVEIYPKDHAPPHAHVKYKGKGTRGETRIGQNCKPLKGDPELSRRQSNVVRKNIKLIRKEIGKSMRRFRQNKR